MSESGGGGTEVAGVVGALSLSSFATVIDTSSEANSSLGAQLVATLASTLSARVAHAHVQPAQRVQSMLDELRTSRPMRSLVHAVRMADGMRCTRINGVAVMRHLLRTGVPPSILTKTNELINDGYSVFTRPLLLSDPFEAFIATALSEAHGASELPVVIRLCAAAAMTREVLLSALEADEEAIDLTDAAKERAREAREALCLPCKDNDGRVIASEEVEEGAAHVADDHTTSRCLAELWTAVTSAVVPDSPVSTSDDWCADRAAFFRLLELRCARVLRAYYHRVAAFLALLGFHDTHPVMRSVARKDSLHIRSLMAEASLPTSAGDLLAARWAREALRSLSDVRLERWSSVRDTPRGLCPLPAKFTDLYTQLSEHKCPATRSFPDEPAICMLCGELLCAGTPCCKRNGVGALTRHVQTCGAGVGLFFFVHRTHTVLLRGPHAAYSISPYLDDHGEEDAGLRRGRPLHLNAERMAQLAALWSEHAVGKEVVHERVMRDRVVREGYY